MGKKIMLTFLSFLILGSTSIKSFAMLSESQIDEGIEDSNLLLCQLDEFTSEQKLALNSKNISFSDALKFKNEFKNVIDKEDMIDYIVSLLSGSDALPIDELQKLNRKGVSFDILKKIKDEGYTVDESTKPFLGKYDGVHYLYASEIIKCLKNSLKVEEVFKFKNAGFTIDEIIEYSRSFNFSDAVFLKENFIDPKTAKEYRAVGLDICESVICAQIFLRPECVTEKVKNCFKMAIDFARREPIGDLFRLENHKIYGSPIEGFSHFGVDNRIHFPIETLGTIKPFCHRNLRISNFSGTIKLLENAKIEEKGKYKQWKNSGFSTEDIELLAECGILCLDAIKFKEHFKDVVDQGNMIDYMVLLLSGYGAASVDDLIELSSEGVSLETLKEVRNREYPINSSTKPFFKKYDGFRCLNYSEIIKCLENDLSIDEVLKFRNAFKNVVDEEDMIDYMVSLLSGNSVTSIDDLIELNNDGVSLDTLKEIRDRGYPIDKSIRPFLEKYDGVRHLYFSEIIKCLDIGIKVEEVFKFKNAGFTINEISKYSENFSFAESVFLKSNFISHIEAEKYKRLNLKVCEAVFLRKNGISTDFNVEEVIENLKICLRMKDEQDHYLLERLLPFKWPCLEEKRGGWEIAENNINNNVFSYIATECE